MSNLIENEWEKGYLRAVRNIKVVNGKFLKRLTKDPLHVMNGGNKLTYQQLKKGLDYEIKKHLTKREERKGKKQYE